MEEIKLIAFDLDGTLLRDNKEVSGRTIEALLKAAERGIWMVPTTGRLYDGIPEKIRTLPFIRYVIAANGAEVYDAVKKKALHREELAVAEAERIFDYAKEAPVIFGCYQGGRGWMDQRDVGRMEEFAISPSLYQTMKSTYFPVEDLRRFLVESGDTVQKLMMFFSDPEARERLLKQMPGDFPKLAVSSSISNNIEVNAGAANKGAALRFLCEHLQLEREESVAFGDGTNDLTMLREAGIGVAMGNAAKEVRDAADQVAKTNEEDGVAVWIEEYLTEGR